MTTQQLEPPRLAAAILSRLGPSNDALTGDLAEALEAGRSRGWYWRQVLGAIAADVRQQVLDNPRLTFYGFLIGWLVDYLSSGPFMLVRFATDRALSGIAPTWVLDSGLYELWRFPLDVVLYAWIGWAIARLNRDHQIPSLVIFLAYKTLESSWFMATAMNMMSSQPPGVFPRYVVVETVRLCIRIAAVLIAGTSSIAGRRGTT